MKIKRTFAKYRKEYLSQAISIRGKNPITLFNKWFKTASKKSRGEPNAMSLATSGKTNTPSSRMVLLKGFSSKGFSFFTNYKSSKAKDISENKRVALLFYWPELERQVRIEGRIKKVSSKDSDNYFRSRPRGAQLGAWVSRQSKPIKNYQALLQKLAYYEEKFGGDFIPRPPNWGGYIVEPSKIEFWQGRRNRLHERLLFTKSGGRWKSSILSP